jgi:hypothetical protein
MEFFINIFSIILTYYSILKRAKEILNLRIKCNLHLKMLSVDLIHFNTFFTRNSYY